MSIGIGANKYQLWGKLILLIVLSGILALLIMVTVHPRGHGIKSPWLLPIFGSLFLTLDFVIFIQLLFLPIGVSINNLSKEIAINYLILGTKYISLSDLESYSSTSIFTKSSEYPGVLIHLSDNKKILLSDFNLDDCSLITSFLEESGKKFNGKEKFKFISYYVQSF